MLAQCRAKIRTLGITAELIEGEAAHLPVRDTSFDAVLRHGGLAEFGNEQSAIQEMFRVVRPGGRVVVCDVGVPEGHGSPRSLVSGNAISAHVIRVWTVLNLSRKILYSFSMTMAPRTAAIGESTGGL